MLIETRKKEKKRKERIDGLYIYMVGSTNVKWRTCGTSLNYMSLTEEFKPETYAVWNAFSRGIDLVKKDVKESSMRLSTEPCDHRTCIGSTN
jgi:hypothetical protein